VLHRLTRNGVMCAALSARRPAAWGAEFPDWPDLQ
jgi:hypothetical protein